MIKRSGSWTKGVGHIVMLRLARFPALVLLLSALLISCTISTSTPGPTPPAKTVSLADDVLLGMDVVDVQRLDADSDGELEWLVFYRFDQVGAQGPVAALVYDVLPRPSGQLPLLWPYKLRTPHENYLAQRVPDVSLVDIVSDPDDLVRKEIVLTTSEEAAFFRMSLDPASRLADVPPLYYCIGFFRSAGGVSFNPETLEVTVSSRAGFERSQLITKHFYQPEADGYFASGTTTLHAPIGSKIDFAEGIPPTILDTPYPEKIVLAFYQTLGKDNADPKATDYLTAQAARELNAGALSYGSPFPGGQLKYAVVKELGYYPTQEDSTATTVTVKVVFRSVSEQSSSLVDVQWTLTRVQNQWKMDFPQS